LEVSLVKEAGRRLKKKDGKVKMEKVAPLSVLTLLEATPRLGKGRKDLPETIPPAQSQKKKKRNSYERRGIRISVKALNYGSARAV